MSRRCIGHNRTGEQCKLAPHPGADVCVKHGAGAPQVRESARRRLLAGADLAIDYLLNMLEPREPCPSCGRSDADRDPVIVRACQLVLDRAGFSSRVEVAVTTAPADPELHNVSDADLLIELEGMCRELRLKEAARLAQENTPLALDASTVDEDAELL